MKFLLVGGPMHGEWLEVKPGVSVIDVGDDLAAYHRTHALSTGIPDPNWWMKGLPEPSSVVIYEWHEKSWESPAVASIREAIAQ